MHYYNDFCKHSIKKLRALNKAGLIPKGIVDYRSIKDVVPSELSPYTQCHFFAGIAGWPLALDFAGWPRTRPVWTASLPCQPFSDGGLRQGLDDERHLWPIFSKLVQRNKPPVIFGEQSASNLALGWLDIVFADLESQGYACAAAGISAAGAGAPHIRHRIYWCAAHVGLVNAYRNSGQRIPETSFEKVSEEKARLKSHSIRSVDCVPSWSEFGWLDCRDGKRRPSESILLPVADGVSEGVGRRVILPVLVPNFKGRIQLIKGYGNAIVPPLAAKFIKAYMDAEDELTSA